MSIESAKARGNAAFKAQDFRAAISAYSEALAEAHILEDAQEDMVNPETVKSVLDAAGDVELGKLIATILGNRAQANCKIEAFGAAIADAEGALAADPSYVKAYYRMGAAQMALGHFRDARAQFKAVIQELPRDRKAREQYAAADKAVKKAAFEAAIASEATKPAMERVDWKAMPANVPAGVPEWADDEPLTPEVVTAWMTYLKDQNRLPNRYIVRLLQEVKPMFDAMPSLIDVDRNHSDAMIRVCGDTHGQYYDTLRIFEMGGMPSADNQYLFNGDFVDRGSFSVENIVVLLAWKLACPEGMNLLRGNHETKNMNQLYGFSGELTAKTDASFYDLFAELFQSLPIAARINKKVFVVHGGLFSTDGVKLEDVKAIPRFCEPPETGLMAEALWSDPQPAPGRGPSKRGVGKTFGPDITQAFLDGNGLDYMIRSHEVRDEGYSVEHGGKLYTVFSAANYCGQCGNKGAFIEIGDENKPNPVQFDAAPCPPVPPMQYAGGLARLMGLTS